ncbi:FAD/NAD(P)-binding protein [Novosphingobium pokkalii]|uniref:FAD/NAD(P)-binding protein n=1 Tax=Novosphingobium pokkalii TaxID=1770194 RepID=UPI0036325C6E
MSPDTSSPVGETLNAWATRQSPQRQAALGLAGTAHDPRAFFPRMALGAYYADQLGRLMTPEAGPCATALHCHAEVQDILARPDGVEVVWKQRGRRHTADFDAVIVASGYGKPDVGARLAGATARTAHGRRVAVLGSSLSAIDAAVELAVRHGHFHEAGDGTLRYALEQPLPSRSCRATACCRRRISGCRKPRRRCAIARPRHWAEWCRAAPETSIALLRCSPASWARPIPVTPPR